jgi:hypothetical protein
LAQALNGCWPHQNTGNGTGPNDPGTTGFTLWAFANSGHLATNDADDDIYAEFVQKGIDCLLSDASTLAPSNQTHIGNPDGDGNGRMIHWDNNGYTTPMAAAGIMAAYSAAPLTPIASGSFAGETYKQIIQDVIDWLAYAQSEGGSPYRGGWYYFANNNGGLADTSIDSWAYVAQEGFEVVFGGSVLEAVKAEAERRIDGSQSQSAPVGRFGYRDTSPIGDGVGNATTGGGLSGLVFVTGGGRTPTLLNTPTPGGLGTATFPNAATRKIKAVEHLGREWGRPPGIWAGNRGNFYAMWTQARALRLNGTGLLVDTTNGVTFDWETGEDQANLGVLPPPNDVHEGYFPFLVRTQNATTGHWDPTVNTSYWTRNLNTAWGILCLQPTVFGPPCDPPVLDAPRSKPGEIQLTWTPGFNNIWNVYRRVTGQSAWTLIAANHASSFATYLDSAVTDGTSYDYYVEATSPDACPSNIVTGTASSGRRRR